MLHKSFIPVNLILNNFATCFIEYIDLSVCYMEMFSLTLAMFSSLPANSKICHPLIIFANSLDPDQLGVFSSPEYL